MLRIGAPEKELPAPTGITNVGGQALPQFGNVEMLPVQQDDGRLTLYPPVEHWDDWVEYEGKSWPKKVARRYMLVPTVCFNCKSGCGLLAYVDKTTLEIKKFEGQPNPPR